MLVQALAAYADTYLKDQLEDPAFESKPVPLMLEISSEGRFLGWIVREESVMRGKKAMKQTPMHRRCQGFCVTGISTNFDSAAFAPLESLSGRRRWCRQGRAQRAPQGSP